MNCINLKNLNKKCLGIFTIWHISALICAIFLMGIFSANSNNNIAWADDSHSSSDFTSEASSPMVTEVAVYRLYNFMSSEHLFTTDKTEYDGLVNLTKQGKSHWKGEGVDWYAPSAGQMFYENNNGQLNNYIEKPVYRLYNKDLGALGRNSHYYTQDEDEMNNLVANYGWKKEKIAFYSGGVVPIYTAYSEALGSQHHYTSDPTEWKGLDGGWNKESNKNGKFGFFRGVRNGKTAATEVTGVYTYTDTVYSNWDAVVIVKGKNLKNIELTWEDGEATEGNIKTYDDIDYSKFDSSTCRVYEIQAFSPGKHNIIVSCVDTLCEGISIRADQKIKLATYSIDLVNGIDKENQYIDWLIENCTDSSMTQLEKMKAISNYLYPKMKYNRYYEDYSMAEWLSDVNTPWFVDFTGNSYVTPQILEKIAKRVGGFSEIHNCYGDYEMYTEEWYQMHMYLRCKEIINGQEEINYFSICPDIDTNIIKKSDIQLIDLTDDSCLTKLSKID